MHACAKAEQYHDFLSDSTPILDLAFALKRAGLSELVAATKRNRCYTSALSQKNNATKAPARI
jgi:hypothetical protein